MTGQIISPYATLIASIAANVTKAQNTDILVEGDVEGPAPSGDFQLTHSTSVVRISICATAAVEVALVPNSGTAILLNNAAALAVNGVHTEEVVLDTGRTWNLQTPNAAGITVTHCIIQAVTR